jgi:hypothetical protein
MRTARVKGACVACRQRVHASVARAPPREAPSQAGDNTSPQEEGTTQKIYVGKGRFIDDNPKKYPDKDGFGTGGWAGGEEGAHWPHLVQFFDTKCKFYG